MRVKTIKYLRTSYYPYLLATLVVLGLFAIPNPKVLAASTYTVTNTNDSGAGSLRQAILDANGNAGADQIDFAISGAGPHTIVLSSNISITDQVKVNGLSQSGSVCNGTSSSLKVVLESNTLITSGVNAAGTEINGLVFGASDARLNISSDSATVRCNFFGTNASGTSGVGTAGYAGLVIYGNSTTIGGNSATDMNLFGRHGIAPLGAEDHVIKNNQIGSDISGMNSLGGALNFAYSTTYQNITISNNLISSISMWYSTYDHLTISGNKIGTNITGTAAIQEHTGTTILINSTLIDSTIGGTTEADGNLIAGASTEDTNSWGHGLHFGASTNVVVQNNKFGVNADASGVVTNNYNNIDIACSNNCINLQILDNIIGGSVIGAGISINNSGATDQNSIYIKRNYLGTNKTFDLNAGNVNEGIILSGTIGNVLVGGTDPADANYIWNNRAGVWNAGNSNTIIGNSIFNNSNLGISNATYNPNDVTENDPGDPDTGANDLLNFPIITEANEDSGNTNVGYSLDVPAGDYRIEFFSNTVADPTGYGEGEIFIGYDEVTSDGAGNQNFSTILSGTGHTHLAATATLIDPDNPSGFGPTSEFGNFEHRADLEVASDDGTMSADSGDTHQYTFTVSNNGPGDVDSFTFQGHSSLFDSAIYTVVNDNSTATTPGNFSDGGWSGLLKSGETLEFTLSGTIYNTGTLNTTDICIVQDSTLQIEGFTVVDPDSNNNCGTDNDTVVATPVADLEISKSLDSPGTIRNGQPATYTISIKNHGPDTAVNATYIYDVLPNGIEYNSTIGDNISCEDPDEAWPFEGTAGHYIACGFVFDGNLDVGETENFKIVVDVVSIDEEQPTLNKALIAYEFDPEYTAIFGAFGAGQDPFTTLTNNSLVTHTYDPNAPIGGSDTDTDSDSISDSIENAGPNGGDANDDGTLDSEQAYVASFVNTVTGEYAVLEVSEECSITSVSIDEESTSHPDTDFSYPTGLIDFTLDCGANGFTADITQYYYGQNSSDFIVRKYNPDTKTYSTIDGAEISQETIDSQSVVKATYQVKDGGSLDLDNTEDGNIHDPAGLAQTTDSLADTGQNTQILVFISGLLLVYGFGVGSYAFSNQRGTKRLIK